MESHRVHAPNTASTHACGARLAKALLMSGVPALVVALEGDLGAGKTVFVRGLGRALGVDPRVPIVSPTFTIARDYKLPGSVLRELHHIDAYRLAGEDDLEAVGFEEMCGLGRLTCVEWSENVATALPEDRLQIRFDYAAGDREAPAPEGEVPEHTRILHFHAYGPQAQRVLAALRDPAALTEDA